MADWTKPYTFVSGDVITHTKLNTMFDSLKTFLEGGNLDRDNLKTKRAWHTVCIPVGDITINETDTWSTLFKMVVPNIVPYGVVKRVAIYYSTSTITDCANDGQLDVHSNGYTVLPAEFEIATGGADAYDEKDCSSYVAAGGEIEIQGRLPSDGADVGTLVFTRLAVTLFIESDVRATDGT